MLKKIYLVFFSVLLSVAARAQYDLVIVGGTPGGIMAAIAAAKQGKSSVILERTAHIGGLPANGLGATDIATRGATTGLFAEYVQRIKQHYISKYGPDSKQVKDCSDGFHFEASVAEA
ncbi:MAG TPA: FAD-dependent oxidoreductase, partial [Chryseosolibacter sp.]